MGDDEVLYEMNLHVGADGMHAPQLPPLMPLGAPRAPSPAVDSAATAATAAGAPRPPPPGLVPMGMGVPSAATAPPPPQGGAPPVSLPGAGASAGALAAMRGLASQLLDQHPPATALNRPSQVRPIVIKVHFDVTMATRAS